MKFQLIPVFFIFVIATACSRHASQIPDEFVPTPKTSSASINYQRPKPLFKTNDILIDAGHGGEDFGAHSVGNPKYHEKTLNLSTASMLRRYLEKLGYSVAMTREDDVFISLDKRAEIANLNKPKIFVSVHFNSAPSKEAEGIEVYFYSNEKNPLRSKESKILADSILKRVINNTNAKSRGVKHGNFAVIRETNMPAVLVECGFLTSPKEMQKIKDATYLKSLSLGIAEGIQDYLSKAL